MWRLPGIRDLARKIGMLKSSNFGVVGNLALWKANNRLIVRAV